MKDFVLLVVDDTQMVDAFASILPPSWRLLTCLNSETVPETGYHAALIDCSESHLDLLRRLKRRNPGLETIGMSESLDLRLMEDCLRAGASRFLAKPINAEELSITLEKIEAYFRLQVRPATDAHRPVWIGSGAVSLRVRREIANLYREPGPILIDGESGTGKDVTAHLIHKQDSRGVMVSVNVAGITESLFESEFFGHLRGSFTGAEQNKKGLSEAAHGGDLFLDEIEALHISHQAKLLRFLETGEVRRVGAKDSVFVQTRVIAATNRNLRELVREGLFRDDLFWRLRGKTLTLPPLRERLEDLPELTAHFLAIDRARKKSLAPDAVAELCNYSWPGNVRELKRVCEQLILMSPLPIIRRDDVLEILQSRLPAAGSTADGIDWSRGLPQLVHDNEAMLIRRALETHRDIDDTAKVLQISRSSLYKKIRDHRIEWKGTT